MSLETTEMVVCTTGIHIHIGVYSILMQVRSMVSLNSSAAVENPDAIFINRTEGVSCFYRPIRERNSGTPLTSGEKRNSAPAPSPSIERSLPAVAVVTYACS